MSESKYDVEGTTMRLLSSDVETRSVALREIEIWPYITIAELLNTAWCQDISAVPNRSFLSQLWAALLRQPAPLLFPQSFDRLAVLMAEHQEDFRFAWVAMEVLQRYYAFCDKVRHADKEEGRPTWGSGIVIQQMPAIKIDSDIDTTSNVPLFGLYTHCEKPLLASLRRLLPRVDTDTFSVSLTGRNTLLYALRYPYRDPELTLCLLDFLGAMGGAECLPTLERLQATSLDTENGRQIRAAAQVCNEQIRLRIDKKRQAQTLLRAAASPAPSDADTLLRSLREAAPDPAPEQLLRPAE